MNSINTDSTKKRTSSKSAEEACIVCGNFQSKHLFFKNQDDRGKGEIILRQCLSCETVFLQNWKSDFISELYDYYAARINLEKSELYEPITESRYQTLLASFKTLTNGTKILDVGCGQGHFVDTAMRLGWDVLGIELSDSAIRICEKFGLPVKKLDFFSNHLIPESFDVLTMFEVIEHVPNPAKFIVRAEQLLKPGGLLYLTTPNFNSLERRIFGADWHVIHREHLVYLTSHTLKQLILHCHNLEIVSLRTKNISVDAIRKMLRLRKAQPFVKPAECTAELQRQLRQNIESSFILNTLKSILNIGLNLSGSGASMVILCRKIK